METKNVSKCSWAAAFAVASVWFGTHVGGGFATGNQVIQYFAQYGWTAAIFPIIAMGILAMVMYVVMSFAKLKGFDNYKDTFAALYPNPKMEILFEIFYIVIILAAVASAVAGAGEVMANFLGIEYVGLAKFLCNIAIVGVLVLLSVFGIKLVMAASTVLSVAILAITACVIFSGLTADMDAITAQYLTANNIEPIAYTSNAFGSIWSGIIVYAAFQCVSIAPMIAASNELSMKGIKRSVILGWVMNGGALAASGYMLSKWYPVLKALQVAGVTGFTNALGIPNQTILNLVGVRTILVLFSLLLFCAFVSTCVTLVYTMVQRFQGVCMPNVIKSEKVRSAVVGFVVICICFALSLLGLSNIIKYAYGYDGYYAIFAVILPVLVWGIPKVRALKGAQKEANTEAKVGNLVADN